MKYLALLRGVNVGGHAIIKMTDLKQTIAHSGFANVRTYIQSGNVIFESDETDTEKIAAILEDVISKRFQFNSRLVVKTDEQVKTIMSEVPDDWKSPSGLRCYVAFVKEPATVRDVLREVEPKAGIDSVKAGEGVLYLTTALSGLTRSGFTKLITRKIYNDITIRNYDTVKNLLSLMES